MSGNVVSGPLPPIRFACGRDDPYLDATRELHRALQRIGVAHPYVEEDGDHDWTYWAGALDATLRFFGDMLHQHP